MEDFGPVYAFWLFSSERLNGTLGNYHTNNHDILMRKYLNETEYASQNWPQEYKDEFLSLLQNYKYNKGSLMANNLEMALDSPDQLVASLPPVQESALFYYEKDDLVEVAAQELHHHNFIIKALIINCYHLGSKSSQYTTSSHVMVKKNSSSTLQLALINHFLHIDILFSENNVCKMWLASASFYCEHQGIVHQLKYGLL